MKMKHNAMTAEWRARQRQLKEKLAIAEALS
jgi:hypothetical protein